MPNYHPFIVSQSRPMKQQSTSVVRMDNRLLLSRMPNEFELPADRKRRMNWTQYKIFAALVAEEVATGGKGEGRYRTTAPELIRMAGLGERSSANVEYVLRVVVDIITKVVVIPRHYDQELGPNTFLAFSPISSAIYSEETGEIHFRINRDILPYINKLKDHFTLAPLQELVALPSMYSGRLFLLMNHCKNLIHEGKRTFSLPWLIAYLGIDPETRPSDIREQLCANRQQIRQHTKWTFDLVFIKDPQDRRRVGAVRLDNIRERAKVGKRQNKGTTSV